MAISFKERLDLLQRTSRRWLELKRAIEALPPQRLTEPMAPGGWTGRELILHLATWDEELMRVIEERDAGEDASWPPPGGAARDAWNAERVAAFRDLPAGDALDYFEQAHFELMELLERSPSVTRALIEPLIAHYDEHLGEINRLRRARR